MAPAASPSPRGRNGTECFDEQVGGHGHEGLGQAGKDSPQGRFPDRSSARHEHQRDGQPLRYVVKGDGGRDKGPQPFGSGEGDADPDPLGEGVRGHDAENQKRLGRTGPL